MTTQNHTPAPPLHAYLLGTLPVDAAAAVQRRLAFDVAGGDPGAVVVCDHPPGVTVGRDGSRHDIRPGPAAFEERGWPVQWVGRGGGTILHLPGQVACYPVLPLDRLGLTVGDYVRELHAVAVDVLREWKVPAETDPTRPGVFSRGRRVAHVGVAVRDGVTSFGLVLNVDPDLAPFRLIGGDPKPMTSAQREAAGRVRPAGVRQRLVDAVAARFGYGRVSLFHAHPVLAPKGHPHARVTPAR